MSTRRITHANSTALYLIAFVVIVAAFLLLGGGSWIKEVTHFHASRSLGIEHWNWVQILVSLGIGLLLGWAIAKRR
jgi:hypothetical protein